ncbi:hypothetical protein TorRG33x02_023720 [Trema orientale]|uniref:Uncharacterized protein n=1 Tax=Trema orientale TaxID=63057 RepID=A0A2P5FV03_TREOI|nr:hypothetical protein TorRG33x02_023720 [Trema orientale]
MKPRLGKRLKTSDMILTEKDLSASEDGLVSEGLVTSPAAASALTSRVSERVLSSLPVSAFVSVYGLSKRLRSA